MRETFTSGSVGGDGGAILLVSTRNQTWLMAGPDGSRCPWFYSFRELGGSQPRW